ncbi:hypothetical protein H3005_19805 [Stenotrophomonas sp. Br8]|uniref:hypothetical protein n=1 Tax=Stenotrophomonas sp. Br8 TaxID=2759658 RepID=UPI00168B6CB0|nr:hypothetical protein [Stenotrophomonas sp. Br8]MBD3684102.1 hypothetical protein [Stenotrophomonas sp. Br8]
MLMVAVAIAIAFAAAAIAPTPFRATLMAAGAAATAGLFAFLQEGTFGVYSALDWSDFPTSVIPPAVAAAVVAWFVSMLKK